MAEQLTGRDVPGANALHPIEVFRRRLESLHDYPAGVEPVPEYLEGTAFFSAAAGLYLAGSAEGLPAFPFGGIMFVGHNLDAIGPFMRRLRAGEPHGGPVRPMLTWRNLYRLLDTAGVDRTSCFFTNAYVGLKSGDDPTGRFPGAASASFTAWCQDFLAKQITVMKPRVVATLGIDAHRFVFGIAPDLVGWGASRLPEMRVNPAVIAWQHCNAIALVHPSGHHGSLHKRSYGGQRGLDAEAALLRDALRF